MFIRNVFKLPASLKNVSFLSQNVFAYHLSHIEKLKGTQEHTEDSDEKLACQLKSSSLSKMLITLQNNKRELQGFHIVAAMSSFYYLLRKEASVITGDLNEPTNIRWQEHPFYRDMSQIIQSNVNKLSGPETVQILYYTKKLRGPYELDNILIEHLKKNMKSLLLEDFRTISSLFKKSEKNKYLANLKNILLKNFIGRVSMDYQKDNIDFLANGLYFLSCDSSKASSKLLDVFVEDIYNFKNDIPLDKSLLIHDSLCYLNYDNFSRKALELLRMIEQNIIKNIDEVEAVTINYILFAISHKIKPSSFSREEFYNAVFIEKLTQRLINCDAGFENALSALICLNKMRHCNIEILNYICASHFEKISLKKEHIVNHNGKLLVLLSGLAQANYKSMFWNEIEEYIKDKQSLLNYNHMTLCILCLNSICLDFYPIEILKKVFDGTYDFAKDNFLHWTFCKIYQKIKTNPSYQGPLPTESQIKSMNFMLENSFKERKKFSCLPYLEEAIGSPTYVKTNVCTKLFHLLDHVVVFDQNDLPIHINSGTNISEKSTIEYLEDLNVPYKSKVVALIMAPSIWYSRNTNELMGPYKVFMDTLNKMNCKVVDINTNMWNGLPDREKKNFLLSKIKSKLKPSMAS